LLVRDYRGEGDSFLPKPADRLVSRFLMKPKHGCDLDPFRWTWFVLLLVVIVAGLALVIVDVGHRWKERRKDVREDRSSNVSVEGLLHVYIEMYK